MKKLIPFIALVMLASFIYLRWNMNKTIYAQVVINNTTVKVEVADTISKQSKGLSGREKLDENSGMLFLMGLPDKYSFWMKEMDFPLDIVWLRDGKVIDLTENVPFPRGYEAPTAVSPKEPADAVLEVNAGFIKAHLIKVGDKVVIGY